MPGPDRRLPYYPALDGMRGIGVLLVLLYHQNLGVVPGAFLCLSMFFTLSGFLIAGLLIAEHRDRGAIDLGRFWERRFRRLLPASTLGLVGALAYTAWLARPDQAARFAKDIFAALLYVPNWRFVVTGQSYEATFSDPSPVQHFWSLGVEEQFYLALPVIVTAFLVRGSLRSFTRVVALLAVASCVAMMLARTDGTPLGHAYYGTDARAAEILIGVLLAIAVDRYGIGSGQRFDRASNLAGLAAVALTVVLWFTTSEHQLWFYRGGAPAYAAVISVVIFASLRPGPVTWLLSRRWMVYLGKRSYGLYVYHFPINLALDALAPQLATPALVSVKLATTFAVSIALYRLVEMPIRTGRRIAGPQWKLAAVAAMTTVAALSIGLAWLPRPGRDDSNSSLRRSASAGRPAGVERARIAVVGNSIAKNLASGLELWSREHDVSILDAARYGCGMMRGGRVRHAGRVDEDDPDGTCTDAQRRVSAMLERQRPDVVLVVTGPMDLRPRQMPGWSTALVPGDRRYDDELVAQYVAQVDRLSSTGARVVWLTFPCHDIEQEVGVLMGTDALDDGRIDTLNRDVLPRVAARRPERMRILDLYARICPGGAFAGEVEGIDDARPDGLHLRPVASRRVADWLGPALLENAVEVRRSRGPKTASPTDPAR